MTKPFRKGCERSGRGLLSAAALLSLVTVALITLFIVARGLPFFETNNLFAFLFTGGWNPSSATNPVYGIRDFLIASVEVTVLSLVFSLPIALASSIYLALFAKGVRKKIVSSSVELLAAIPSVIYGLFGIATVVPLTRTLFGGNGYSLLSASVILAIMILPTIITVCETAISSVSPDLIEASYGLGATTSETIFRVILPAAKSGIVAGVILAMGRALGETTAVLLVGGNAAVFPKSLVSMCRTLTMNIVTDMSYAEGVHLSALFATAMVLYILILVLNIIVVKTVGKARR